MRTPTVTITCDLCGHEGSDPAWFHSRPGGVDLCYWCMGDPPPGSRMSCGRHDITFADDWSWSCSCGEQWVPWMYVKQPGGGAPAPHVRAAVPNMRYALARIHSEQH